MELGKWCRTSLILLIVFLVLVSVMPLQSNARANSLVSYREALEKTREAQEFLAGHHSRPHRTNRRPGRHVCARSKVVNSSVKHHQSYHKPVYKTIRRPCDDNPAKTCTSYRLVYEIAYRTVYKTTPRTVTSYECCPGWTRRIPSARGCMKAICSPTCENRGICKKPNKCSCSPGWTGSTCETDVDECLNGNTKCDHKCINIPGSYTCECHAGFNLHVDKKSCKMNLHVIPEYQEFLHGYQELNQRIVMLEKMQEQHNLTDLEYRVEKIAKSVSSMTEKNSPSYSDLPDKTKTDNYAFYGSPWERVHSLSEQISMLEERLADCTCNQPQQSRPRL